ncbi:MAG TPA: alpha/beta family hydrolase [Burkholderiales bacterium]|nr:alpha/beta family hydrolase [Burkholderiales bacterium]
MIFVCAHGAGGHKDDRSMLALDEALTGIGVQVVRFDFPYREKGRKIPDPMPVLKSAIRDVASQFPKAVIGGRSMGGRAASMLAADGFACAGLLLFAYPLHPAGQLDKLRVGHFQEIRTPVLCFNGTRDALCRRDLMEKYVPATWNMQWLEGADHSLKRGADLEAIARETQRWLATL